MSYWICMSQWILELRCRILTKSAIVHERTALSHSEKSCVLQRCEHKAICWKLPVDFCHCKTKDFTQSFYDPPMVSSSNGWAWINCDGYLVLVSTSSYRIFHAYAWTGVKESSPWMMQMIATCWWELVLRRPPHVRLLGRQPMLPTKWIHVYFILYSDNV